MENYFDYPKKILDFLTLLQTEQAKENSDLFNATIWQDLTRLSGVLDTVNQPNEIGNAILDWCDEHPKIMEALNQTDWGKLRGDVDDESDGVIPESNPSNEGDRVHNTYEIVQEIKSIINAKQNENTPNDPIS